METPPLLGIIKETYLPERGELCNFEAEIRIWLVRSSHSQRKVVP